MLLPLSSQQIEEIEVLGTVVIYRPSNSTLGENVIPAMIAEYNIERGVANLWLVGKDYHIPNVPYSMNLGSVNSWCWKEDAPAVGVELPKEDPPKSEEVCPETGSEPVEELGASGSEEAASEGDTTVSPA